MPENPAWVEAQKFEAEWWGSCAHTFGEEAKQCTYAHRMGLVNIGADGGHWPLYDLAGKSVLDLGGGPVSMLLKCINVGRAVVVDPGKYPAWVKARYKGAGVELVTKKAESYRLAANHFDEAWIYNVLQHVVDPETVIANACALADTVRIFEWVDLPAYEGHIHTLRQTELDSWLRTAGTVEEVHENGAHGRCYYAVAEGWR